MLKIKKSMASADRTADTVYRIAQTISTFLRPTASMIGPAIRVPDIAPKLIAVAVNPNSHSLRLKYVSIKGKTPEITEKSNPSKNPPRATITEIMPAYNNLIISNSF
jgi:hypothetical protein